MAEALRDENHIPTLLGVLNSDGETTMQVKANALLNALKVSDGTSGSDFGENNASRDQNHVPVLMAVSAVDGVTPVPVYADSNGNLLVTTI